MRPQENKQLSAVLALIKGEQEKAARLAERKTRFAVLFRDNDRRSAHLINTLMDVVEPLSRPAPRLRTFDRGFEFCVWRKPKSGIGPESCFRDPLAPWQKGSVENLSKHARRFLPRDTQFAALSNRDMKAICDRLKARPSKCLGWRTEPEAFRDEMMETQIAQAVATSREP